MSADAIADAQWLRVADALKLWPGAVAIGKTRVDEYVRALRMHLDPVAAELALDVLRLEQDGRPSIAAIIGVARRSAPRSDRDLDAGEPEPPAAWVVAHAVASGSSLAGYMTSVALRHGIEPILHRPEACELCIVDELESAKVEELERVYGPEWLRVDAALVELTEFELELDRRFTWRVLTATS